MRSRQHITVRTDNDAAADAHAVGNTHNSRTRFVVRRQQLLLPLPAELLKSPE